MIKVGAYGSGNINAIVNILQRLNTSFEVCSSSQQLRGASKLILPGVGAFDRSLELLQASGMRDELHRLVIEKEVPILGVCVGMQMMAESSEEGTLRGLGWVRGQVVKIDTGALRHKPSLPHMGWNSIRTTKPHPVLEGIDEVRGFYFLHSYCLECEDSEDVLAFSQYGGSIAAAVNHRNVYGIQFHPEKSHQNGIRLFKNFSEL